MGLIPALEICANVAFFFSVPPADLAYSKKTSIWTQADDARAVAIWLIRRRTNMSHQQIATLFCIRASLAYAVINNIERDTAQRIRRDPLLRAHVAAIQAELDQIALDRAIATNTELVAA